MKNFTLYFLLAATAATILAGCANNDGTVRISGTVSDAQGEKLALMHLSGNNPVLVDTVTLDANGSFKFQPKVEQGGPDFFCLVLGGQTIPVVSDTLQTPVELTTDREHFSNGYQVKDSLNNVLKAATALGNELRRNMMLLTQQRQQNKVSQLVYNDSLQSMVATYKDQVLHKYIYQDPASPVSYYLLFETVSGLQVFDTYNVKDNRAYGAVANLWLNTYPNSPRTAFLEQRTREGMAARLKARQEQERTDSIIKNVTIDESNFVELNLLGVNDTPVALSSINGHGTVTLVDFTAYYISDVSVAHNEALSKVYEKYKGQGLKIYQVCMDPDENFWKVSATNIPWTVVRDTELLFDQQGMVQYSAAAALYNVTNIPTTFVMARDGSPVSRIEDDSKLDAAVAKAM